MIDKKNIISQNATILEALSALNELAPNPLILFVVDEDNKMVGSLTDGDIRRSLISGATLKSFLSVAMHKNFKYIVQNNIDNALFIRTLKKKRITLVPVLDNERHIIDAIDLQKVITRLPVDAVLMAGGKGERLIPLTLNTPKPLLKIANKPIIDYNIENLMRYGIENINVTVNYLANQIEKHFEKPFNGRQIKCIRETKFLGTMGSLDIIKEWHNDTILLMNSDLFTNINLESFYLHFKKYNADMSVAAVPYNVNIPYGIFEIRNTREIKCIEEKPSYHYYANAGIYLFKKELLPLIPHNQFYNATDFMIKIIELGKKVIRFPIAGYWIDVGKPEDFKNVQEFARNIEQVS